MLPIFAMTGLAMAMTGLTACDGKQPSAAPSQPPSAAAPESPKPAPGDDKKACATAKTVRQTLFNDLLLASMTIGDKESTATEITEAAATLKSTFTKLAETMSTAAEQAQSDKLRESFRAYAAGAKTVVANVEAAGSDRSKLDNATEVAALDSAEKTVLELCA
ncbi:hypothetical protein Rhe02_07090 [Rhizocola hellebori]|uniref:Lipoprotein n=2 Tax=Rhizocola hellebori TaxID=1392758 RepID=A0A8J3Q380_9ACTN|nr:hypothetical protein Rhe02_07090 [Rhizocola hellebori]